jgi:hypothetical protein
VAEIVVVVVLAILVVTLFALGTARDTHKRGPRDDREP